MSGKIQGVRNQSKRPKRGGFTLLELLAVIVVVVLLAALALPALAGSKGRTKIGQCASNLKQFGLAMQMYGQDNGDRLPSGAAGWWAYDFPWTEAYSISRYGVAWQSLYCPGTFPRFSDRENYELYNYVQPLFRIFGYANTLPGNSSVIQSNQNSGFVPKSIQVGTTLMSPPLPGMRVLLADATISSAGQNDPSQRYSPDYNYTSIQGGYRVKHLSPHLVGRFPSGGNLAMLDGHVEWRAFADMQVRTTGTGPVFWW